MENWFISFTKHESKSQINQSAKQVKTEFQIDQKLYQKCLASENDKTKPEVNPLENVNKDENSVILQLRLPQKQYNWSFLQKFSQLTHLTIECNYLFNSYYFKEIA